MCKCEIFAWGLSVKVEAKNKACERGWDLCGKVKSLQGVIDKNFETKTKLTVWKILWGVGEGCAKGKIALSKL